MRLFIYLAMPVAMPYSNTVDSNEHNSFPIRFYYKCVVFLFLYLLKETFM